jgi:hypothetical protein
MLCQGCASRELSRTSAQKKPNQDGVHLKPKPQESFDFWEGDLAPNESLHPLHQPLPNSVWEKYAQHRQLLGKPSIMHPDHLKEAEARGQEDAGDSDPFPGSRGEAEQKKQGPGKQQRLRLWRRRRGSLGKTAAEAPHPQGGNELAQHLMDHHGVGDWELQGMDHQELQDQHDQFHHNTAYSGSDAPDHTHPDGVAEKETTGQELHPPAKTLKGKQLVDHLKNEHNLPHNEIVNAFKSGGDHPTDGGHGAAVKWHDEAHATGAPHAHDHAHEEFGANGPEQLKHPSKFTNSSLHSHLLEDHGIHPDHMANAIDGTFEATDPSHVVHMLHNAAHASGQVKFDHTHEGWSGGPEIHEGHTDVGKPFWGAPPDTAQKSIGHLTAKKSQGGHGLSHDQVNELMKPITGGKKLYEDHEYHQAYEQVHGDLHQQGGDDVNHQHVPTIQPGVLSPAKAKKEQLKKHLHEYHGVSHAPNPEMTHSELHDPDAYAYKGHPGHEHTPWDPHGPLTHELPSGYSMPPKKNPGPDDFVSIKPFNPGHHDHPTKMTPNELQQHIDSHHKDWTVGKNGEDPTPPTVEQFADNFFDFDSHTKTHEELLQEHALHHATGETNGHTHEAGGWDNPLENSNAHYGLEPEIQTDTHPHIDNDHEALAHMIKHHPNVTQENYDDWHKSHQTGVKPTMVKFHEALHNGGTYGSGDKLPKVLDGHDHAEASGPPTQIAVGSHLVHEHGMSQEDVAAMTPAEFKAHHEKLHLKQSELDVGHGHIHPGGPMRDPRVILPNTHHQAMRDDDRHPAVQEWYHGTSTDYEGAPKNATELKEDHGFWGNFGGGDWNNHVGTHWSSLHEMSRNFNGGSNRVIHAKLHISNPIVYNSLNHMAHDAYERLRASGHLQDDGYFENNHGDDNGYNECCSGRLLEYAKGHHRDDGKFGLEAYRDSLRASGYDGIHVRNQADHPSGHWNAIPLSADQIEITHGGCRGHHGDERDNDVQEFADNKGKLTRGWQHPKYFKASDYYGPRLDHLPTDSEVEEANRTKRTAPSSNKTAEGRGDADPYLGDRDPEDLDEDNESHYCEHCDENTDHETEDCTISKWCNVCEEYGDHETADEHDYCDHCEDYADHDSDECDKNPDNAGVEAYCPHCDQSHLDNKLNKKCVSCGNELPDWGKLQSQGTPVKPGEYKEDGETEGAAYDHASEAEISGGKDAGDLAAHLYHHHKSDVSGKEFDDNGSWNEDALKYHHQWLHQNPEQAKSHGFEMDHDHKNHFGQFKKSMTPEETHAHMMMAHCGPKQGGVGSFDLGDVAKMTPEQAVAAHKKAHAVDDAVQWGQKDSDGDLVNKITHTHNLEGDQGSFDEVHYPEGDKLLDHLQDSKYHMKSLPWYVTDALQKHPGVAEALHHQLHKNFGPSAQEGVDKYHVHTPELLDEIDQKHAIKQHLKEHHGAPDYFLATSSPLEKLMQTHNQQHQSNFPLWGTMPTEHTHFGGTAHQDPTGHTDANMKVKKDGPEPEAPKKDVKSPELMKAPAHELLTGNSGYDMEDHLSLHHPEVHKALQHAEGFDYAPGTEKFTKALQEAHEAHMKAHAEGSDHNHGGTAMAKESSRRRTLSDLFEEVAS